MAWRRFVLEPAAEIAGEMRHPVVGWTIAQLFEHLKTARPYIALGGPIGAGKSLLAAKLCENLHARFAAETLDEAKLATFYRDSASQAWGMELEFLEMRRRLLSASNGGETVWSDGRLVVSDFWFDQSAAFARVWLDADRYVDFERHFEEKRREVVRPKLLVLLDAPVEELLRRIRRRGRRGEDLLTLDQLERIRHSILRRASMPDVGPTLKLGSGDAEESLKEVTAAIESME
jgi:deoxyadenosine/deoxycytidine kinase